MTVRIITGHVMDGLAQLVDESVHCIVTSPPYYGLRSYGSEPQIWGGDPNCGNTPWVDDARVGFGHDWGDEVIRKGEIWKKENLDCSFAENQPTRANSDAWEKVERHSALCRNCGAWRGDLGLEPSPELFIQHLVEIFREVRRVLRKDGTLWLNMGDSYCSGATAMSGSFRADDPNNKRNGRGNRDGVMAPNCKPKDLLMIPAQLALALRADGWYLRSEIVWAKKAPMPESVTDRPTCAHEKVFLLSKSSRYFYDAEAVKEEADRAGETAGGNYTQKTVLPLHRNMRNIWHLGPEPYPDAHFATFVTEIPRRAILAGTSAKGVCGTCGAPWVRVVESKSIAGRPNSDSVRGKCDSSNRGIGAPQRGCMYAETDTIGWRAGCSCGPEAMPVPATVCDPFLGAGTTALVADQLGRHCIGIELNPQYVTMAEKRLREDAGMFLQMAAQ